MLCLVSLPSSSIVEVAVAVIVAAVAVAAVAVAAVIVTGTRFGVVVVGGVWVVAEV